MKFFDEAKIEVIAGKCGLDVALISQEVVDLQHGCSAFRTILLTSDRKPWQRRLTVGHVRGICGDEVGTNSSGGAS